MEGKQGSDLSVCQTEGLAGEVNVGDREQREGVIRHFFCKLTFIWLFNINLTFCITSKFV